MRAESFQSCPTLCNPMDCVAHQVPLSMGFSRQEYWSGLPCPPPGDCPDLGIKLESLTSPALAGKFFNTSATWKAHHNTVTCFYSYSHFMEDVTETYWGEINFTKQWTVVAHCWSQITGLSSIYSWHYIIRLFLPLFWKITFYNKFESKLYFYPYMCLLVPGYHFFTSFHLCHLLWIT